MRFPLVIVCSLLLLSFKQSNDTRQISLDFSSRILERGKYVSVSGQVFFRKTDGVLTTHLVKPFENVTIVNAAGEMKIYDPIANTIIQNHSALNSSESSYFYHFLNGSYNDLGYGKAGYVISGTRLEKGLMITNWVPRKGFSTPISSIELAQEKSLPIFVSFKDNRNKLLGKIYFSSYQKIGSLQLPLKITEIMYKEKKDSVITVKHYSNPKLNQAADAAWLDFKIPANARVIETK